MSNALAVRFTKYLAASAVMLGLAANAPVALAEDFTAGVVLDKMSVPERAAYIAGVIEGLAYSRYAKDGQTTAGMGCIYDWYYENDNSIPAIVEAFDKFRDYTPGAVISAMVEKECGT